MGRGRGRPAALMLGAVALLVTFGAAAASGTAASATAQTSPKTITTPGRACMRGWECNDAGPLATQAACEAARAPSSPPNYYSFPCYYGYESYAPYDGGLGWYWTFEFNPGS